LFNSFGGVRYAQSFGLIASRRAARCPIVEYRRIWANMGEYSEYS
jgi:hypothetical protein